MQYIYISIYILSKNIPAALSVKEERHIKRHQEIQIPLLKIYSADDHYIYLLLLYYRSFIDCKSPLL